MMNNRKLFLGIIILSVIFTILFFLSFLGFYLRLIIPTRLHFILPFSIFILANVFAYFSIRIGIKLNISDYIKPFLTIAFIIGINVILDKLSYCKRESEIENYMSCNEDKILNLIDYYSEHGEDKRCDELLDEMNIRGICYHNDEYHLGLYGFMGYGYRILYSEKDIPIKPYSPGGSPTVKWFKIKDHWYYYSYWD